MAFSNIIKFLNAKISIRFAFPFLFDFCCICESVWFKNSRQFCGGFDWTEEQWRQVCLWPLLTNCKPSGQDREPVVWWGHCPLVDSSWEFQNTSIISKTDLQNLSSIKLEFLYVLKLVINYNLKYWVLPRQLAINSEVLATKERNICEIKHRKPNLSWAE